jgi:hypothetical protein
LRFVVLEHGEVVARQAVERPAVAVDDQRVDLDETGIGAEDGWLALAPQIRPDDQGARDESADCRFQNADCKADSPVAEHLCGVNPRHRPGPATIPNATNAPNYEKIDLNHEGRRTRRRTKKTGWYKIS